MNTENTELNTPGFGESIQCITYERPYSTGICGHDDRRWDVIHPDGERRGVSYGDKKEAEELCDMLNIAYALGRASNARN